MGESAVAFRLTMLLSNLEYVPLRLLRRFVFRDAFMLHWGRLFPYYRTSFNQTDPSPLVDAYLRLRPEASRCREVLEIGVGATNSTGYELAGRLPEARFTLLEPFVPLEAATDRALLQRAAIRHHADPAALARRVRRVRTLTDEPDGRYDLVLSSSVLEHVGNLAALFGELRRVLSPGGEMLHLVDYRDHFFKYPLHFLQFRRATWERWLNPGDLPRWRAYDHVEALERAGFAVALMEARRDEIRFARMAARISPDFRRDDPRVAILFAALHCRPT